MRKSIIILLLIIQITLLFLFSNFHSLLTEIEKKEEGLNEYKKGLSSQSLNVIVTINKIFSYLIIVLAIFILITGGFLIYSLSSKKKKVETPDIPQLQNYLYQLKDSEIQLKNLVEQQQQKVITSDELSRNIINAMEAAIILLNKGNKIEIFNKSAERILNKSLALAKNNDFFTILSDYESIINIVKENINKKRYYSEITSNKKHFKIELIQMKDIGMLIILDDITEEKKREEILQKNKNFIMLGEMAAFLVHEVRNSLGVIFGYTRTIEKEVVKIDKVNKEIVFLTDMMERFLNFSKPIKEEKKTEIDLKDMIKNIADKYNISIVQTGDQVNLNVDPIQMEIVISNLIRNAVEASASEILINVEKKDNLIIYIKDNGNGIDNANLDRIWFPFFTTKTKGTGMGLALVKKSLHYLNGDISLVKSDENGSEFKVEMY